MLIFFKTILSRKNSRGGGELLLKNGTHCAGPWYLEDYRNILLPNVGEDQKNLTSDRGAPGTVPYDKSGPGNCITFIKRLDEGLR